MFFDLTPRTSINNDNNKNSDKSNKYYADLKKNGLHLKQKKFN